MHRRNFLSLALAGLASLATIPSIVRGFVAPKLQQYNDNKIVFDTVEVLPDGSKVGQVYVYVKTDKYVSLEDSYEEIVYGNSGNTVRLQSLGHWTERP